MKDILVISLESLNGTTAGGIGHFSYLFSDRLASKGWLKYFVVSSKGKHTTGFDCRPVSPFARYYLFVLNFLWSKKIIGYSFKRRFEEKLFDIFCANHINKDIRVLFTTHAFLPVTFKKARQKNIKIIYFPPTPDELFIRDKVRQEYEKWNYNGYDIYTYEPRLRTYTKSLPFIDEVLCMNPLVLESFEANNLFTGKKILVKGSLWESKKINMLPVRKTEPVVLGFLAHILPLKGLQNLIKVFKNLNDTSVKLLIGGRMHKSVLQILKNANIDKVKGVEYFGTFHEKTTFMQEICGLIVPSVIDASPMVVYESLSFGKPVLVSHYCGNANAITEGENGFVYDGTDDDLLLKLTKFISLIRKIQSPVHCEIDDINVLMDSLEKHFFYNFYKRI